MFLAGMVSALDEAVGDIMIALEARGFMKYAILVFITKFSYCLSSTLIADVSCRHGVGFRRGGRQYNRSFRSPGLHEKRSPGVHN